MGQHNVQTRPTIFCNKMETNLEDSAIGDTWLNEIRTIWETTDSNELKKALDEGFNFQNQYEQYDCHDSLLNKTTRETETNNVLCQELDSTHLNQWLLKHKNGVMMLGLSQNHPSIVATVAYNKKYVDSVRQQFPIRVHIQNAITHKEIQGKRRRGAVQCQPSADICAIHIPILLFNNESHTDIKENGTLSFTIKGCIFGSIIDFNNQLETLFNNLHNTVTEDVEKLFWVLMVMPHSKHQQQKSLAFHTRIPIDPI